MGNGVKNGNGVEGGRGELWLGYGLMGGGINSHIIINAREEKTTVRS